MSGVDAPAPWRIAFDNARDPYTARNALGAEKIGGGGGGGGTAPDNAEYIVAATDATLTAERVLTNTASITWDFTTPGQAKASTAAGGGNVSNSGTPTLGQYAKWVTATTIQGVNAATVLGDIGAQPLDADLTAIAALTGTNTIYYRSAANTWSPVVISTGLAFSGGNLTCTVSTAGSQPLDATLTALAAYNTNGLLTQTAADTFTGRTLTGPAAGITVSNGNGVGGNPTLALADDLAALEALTGTNTIYYRSGTSAWTAVTIGTNLTFSGGTLSASAGGGGDVFLAGNNTFTGQNYFNGGSNLPLVIGHTARLDTTTSPLEIQRAGISQVWHTAWDNSAGNSAYFNFAKSRGGSIGTHTIVQDGDTLGAFQFTGSNGTTFNTAAIIRCKVDGTPAAGATVPGMLEFLTRPAGGVNTERARFDSTGAWLVVGMTDGSTIATGKVGEEVIYRRGYASRTGLTNSANTNVGSIALTAGEWELSYMSSYHAEATPTGNAIQSMLSTSSTVADADSSIGEPLFIGGNQFVTGFVSLTCPPFTIRTTSARTYYLLMFHNLGAGVAVYGTCFIRARRVR